MINSFESYIQNRTVEKKLPDIHQAHALMNKAEKRLQYVKERPVLQESAQFIFEDSYDVMREAGQALMTLQGFKPLSHEAVIAFLHDKEGVDKATAEKFDSFRRLRNKSLYEAHEISAAKAKEALNFAEELLATLRAKLKA